MTVGKRLRPAPFSGLRVFAPVSVIVLLALVCFPVLAQAEDSSGVQYSDSIPKAEGENTPAPHKQQTPAKSSSTYGGGGTPSSGAKGPDGSNQAGSSKVESSSKSGSAAGSDSSGSNGQGSQAGSGNGASGAGVQGASQSSAGPAATAPSDGGSSPLVPILIAILALAAISVGVVMYRQRRQRSGPAGTPTPEAR